MLVAAGVLKKERQGKITVFAPVVTLAEFRKPKSVKPRETVGAWLRKDIAKRAKIPTGFQWKDSPAAKGLYRIVRDGEPLYFAGHVKGWKAGNKAALCLGYDPWGLMLNPARARWQFAPRAEDRAPTLFDFARWQRRLAYAL